MTIKTRNRLTLGFLTFSSIVFLAELTLLIFQLFKGNLAIPQVHFSTEPKTNFLIGYNFIYVILGILFQNLFVFFASFFILRAFEKTQTTEIFYFMMFLLACLCDSARIFIPLLHISGTYSRLLMVIGNITLFARILVPLSLMSTVVLNSEDMRKNLEQISLVLVIVSAFIAEELPLNTSYIEPNLLVSYGYAKAIKTATIVIHLANIFTLLVRNYIKESNQNTTLGYVMLTAGNYLMFDCTNLLSLVLGFILLSFGTYIFLKALHKYYLWND